mmetsp:Transcript_26222/g.66089  ORF Transcript_26222/g.66089 Transcript_26222/m.66089 type:complete len:106 (-) Transcript_26222:1-318(-)
MQPMNCLSAVRMQGPVRLHGLVSLTGASAAGAKFRCSAMTLHRLLTPLITMTIIEGAHPKGAKDHSHFSLLRLARSCVEPCVAAVRWNTLHSLPQPPLVHSQARL